MPSLSRRLVSLNTCLYLETILLLLFKWLSLSPSAQALGYHWDSPCVLFSHCWGGTAAHSTRHIIYSPWSHQACPPMSGPLHLLFPEPDTLSPWSLYAWFFLSIQVSVQMPPSQRGLFRTASLNLFSYQSLFILLHCFNFFLALHFHYLKSSEFPSPTQQTRATTQQTSPTLSGLKQEDFIVSYCFVGQIFG